MAFVCTRTIPSIGGASGRSQTGPKDGTTLGVVLLKEITGAPRTLIRRARPRSERSGRVSAARCTLAAGGWTSSARLAPGATLDPPLTFLGRRELRPDPPRRAPTVASPSLGGFDRREPIGAGRSPGDPAIHFRRSPLPAPHVSHVIVTATLGSRPVHQLASLSLSFNPVINVLSTSESSARLSRRAYAWRLIPIISASSVCVVPRGTSK